MKKISIAAALLSSASFFASAAQAQTIYTDRAAFLAAVSGTATTTFEQNAAGQYTFYGALYTGSGFTIANSTGLGFSVDPDFNPSLYQWNSGDVYDAERGVLTITAGTALRGFGFDFGNPSRSDFNSTNGTITVNGVSYTQIGQPAFNFFGITNAAGGIGSITVNFNGGLGILDNVVTATDATAAVPEPATWGMMLLGFGVVGASMRRRKANVRTRVRFA